MHNLPPEGEFQTQATFIIIKEPSGFKLALKPIKQGALLTIYNVNGFKPIFEHGDPLRLEHADDNLAYRVDPHADTATYRFNMGQSSSMPSSFPYTLRIEEDGYGIAALHWSEFGLKVAETVSGVDQASVLFVKGYTAAEHFEDAVALRVGNALYRLPSGQDSGVWTSPRLDQKTLFHFGVGSATAREVIGDEDADMEIIPSGGS